MARLHPGVMLAACFITTAAGAGVAFGARHTCADVPDGLFSGDRYQVAGDGTFTDMTTGLQWQIWDGDFGTPGLQWGLNGTFWWLHTQFNDGALHYRHMTPLASCHGGRCDWRVPTVEEAWTLIDIGVQCGESCTSVPGPLDHQTYPMWTATAAGTDPYRGEFEPSEAFVVDLVTGATRAESTSEFFGLRPVRGEAGAGPALMIRDEAIGAVAAWSDLYCFLDDPACECLGQIAEAEPGAGAFESWRAAMGEIRGACHVDDPARTLSGMAKEAASIACE